MVLTFNEEKELVELKHAHAKELLEANNHAKAQEHQQKMARLDKLLEIAKTGNLRNVEGI
jgi:hypothetical protein